jgi:hypothetical protein
VCMCVCMCVCLHSHLVFVYQCTHTFINIQSYTRTHIQVNASPSLTASTKADRLMKTNLMRDILSVVVPPDFPGRAVCVCAYAVCMCGVYVCVCVLATQMCCVRIVLLYDPLSLLCTLTLTTPIHTHKHTYHTHPRHPNQQRRHGLEQTAPNRQL